MSNITVKRYHFQDKELWNNFNKTTKNPLFMFDRNYMDYHQDRFVDNSLMFFEADKLIGLLPANIAGDSLVSHGGLTYGGLLLGDKIKQHTVNECLEALIEYMKEERLDRLVYKPVPHIYHEQPCEEELYALHSNGARLMEVCASTVINLEHPLKMPKGRTAQINRARREGVEVKKIMEKKGFDKFIEIENQVLGSKHNVQAVHTSDELFMLHKRFPSNIHLYGSVYKDELIAGAVIYEYGRVIHTQYMAANDLARQIGGLDLSIQAVIEDYKHSKKWLDFGISTENGGKYLNEGLISQKESFGGRTNIYQLWELIV